MWLLAGPTKCNWPSVTLWSVFANPVTFVYALYNVCQWPALEHEQMIKHLAQNSSESSGVSRLEGLVGPQTCKFSMCSLIQQLQEKNLS